jgi:hypothetical protein
VRLSVRFYRHVDDQTTAVRVVYVQTQGGQELPTDLSYLHGARVEIVGVDFVSLAEAANYPRERFDQVAGLLSQIRAEGAVVVGKAVIDTRRATATAPRRTGSSICADAGSCLVRTRRGACASDPAPGSSTF